MLARLFSLVRDNLGILWVSSHLMGRVEEPEPPKIDLHKAYCMIW